MTVLKTTEVSFLKKETKKDKSAVKVVYNIFSHLLMLINCR